MIAWLVSALWGVPGISVPAAMQEVDRAEVERWVELLDADDPAKREEAREALLRKGLAVIPALKSLQESARPGVAPSLRVLIGRLEREAELLRAPGPVRRVTLQRARRTVGRILEEIERQTGDRILPDKEVPLNKEVEIGWDAVPVLQAVDELCATLGHEFVQEHEEGPIEIVRLETPRAVAVSSYSGQFRMTLELDSPEDISYRLTAQPGDLPLTGVLRWLEATDDLGRTIILREDRIEEEEGSLWSLAPGIHLEAIIQQAFYGGPHYLPWRVKDGARNIKRIRCLARLFFGSNRVTKTLKLKDLINEKAPRLHVGAGSIQILAVGKYSDGNRQILFRNPKYPIPWSIQDKCKGMFSVSYLLEGPFYGFCHIDFLDGKGEMLQWSSAREDKERHFHITRHHEDCPHVVGGHLNVEAVGFSGILGVRAIDVPFEFRDVPLPAAKK